MWCSPRRGVDPIPITDQVGRSLAPRECLRDSACDSFRGWIRSNVEPDKVSAGQPNEDEDLEQIEAKQRTDRWRRRDGGTA
jgi:hypothetical protein